MSFNHDCNLNQDIFVPKPKHTLITSAHGEKMELLALQWCITVSESTGKWCCPANSGIWPWNAYKCCWVRHWAPNSSSSLTVEDLLFKLLAISVEYQDPVKYRSSCTSHLRGSISLSDVLISSFSVTAEKSWMSSFQSKRWYFDISAV